DGVLYVAEPHVHQIVRYDGGSFTPVVGSGALGDSDGTSGRTAQLHDPDTIRFDGFGNLYFPDFGNNKVRKWSTVTDTVTTVAGLGSRGNGVGSPDNTQLDITDGCCSSGITFDSDGNLYISDFGNDRILKIWVVPPK